jgi:hypothetical protein
LDSPWNEPACRTPEHCPRTIHSKTFALLVRETIALQGFDEVEPVVRKMNDGALVLLFASLPPFVADGERGNPRPFDLDAFGAALIEAVSADVAWEDRDLFVIQQPRTDSLERLRGFLGGYWKGRRRPWWKLW